MKQRTTVSFTIQWLLSVRTHSVKNCSIWCASKLILSRSINVVCKVCLSVSVLQRKVAAKNLQRSFKKKEAIHFQTIEDHNGNFLAGLERRKLQEKVQISHLCDGRHFSSRRGSGLETTLASISCLSVFSWPRGFPPVETPFTPTC